MFDHVKFGVRNFAVSKNFYLKALEPIGVTGITDWPPDGAELYQPAGDSSLCCRVWMLLVNSTSILSLVTKGRYCQPARRI